MLKPVVRDEARVESEGVWQIAQPTELNKLRPLLIEVAPPGVVVLGVGGARNRMKMAKPIRSLDVPKAVPSLKLV